MIKGTGDGVHAVFATADQAVAAAIAAQRAIVAEPWGSVGPLRVRMGLHTGVAEERGGDYYGPVLNRAARLMGVAHGGQVLCSQTTADLVRDSSAPPGASDRARAAQPPRPRSARGRVPGRAPGAPAPSFPRLPTVVAGRGEPATSAHVVRRARRGSPGDPGPARRHAVGHTHRRRWGRQDPARDRDREPHGAPVPRRAWLCELASVRDAESVASALLETFGLEPRQGSSIDDTLWQFLAAKDLLVVLDNCEHLLRPVAALVGTIVRACPGVRVLATSREGLGLPGERILAVAFAGPPRRERRHRRDRGERCGAALRRAGAGGAGRLRGRRGQRRGGRGGVPTTRRCPARDRACRGTGRDAHADRARPTPRPALPSAHGQRARRVERHQTLRAAIDWSYDLLDEPERRVLDRLSVFAGSFSLDAAEAVTSGGVVDRVDVFELLAGLVARSLVQADDGRQRDAVPAAGDRPAVRAGASGRCRRDRVGSCRARALVRRVRRGSARYLPRGARLGARSAAE